ncbi:hypothetical protein E2C01_031879 [Portunus trituberculatus]|uniref:SH2 domain-containing protein n=1 Tax=Portunus trituberculatus TaxID=210409 RepID=A0A5B7EZT6_PORTR|nr:hypothetical protein [Portunus trituberculatus]
METGQHEPSVALVLHLMTRNEGMSRHCLISTQQEGDMTTYSLKEGDSFPSLKALIENYRNFPICIKVISDKFDDSHKPEINFSFVHIQILPDLE